MKFVAELTNTKVLCNELKVKDYKELLKCSFGDEPDELIFIETVCDIFANMTNKPADYFKNISIIDFFLLLLETRINSQGDSCKVNVTKEGKQMSLELRLDYIRDEVKEIFKSFNTTIKQDNVEVGFECPSVQRLLDYKNKDGYLYFINKASIKSGNSVKTMEINNNEEAELLLEKLSPRVSLQIINQFQDVSKCCIKTNFLKRYKIEDQKLNFTPSIDSLIWYTKLIFSESLDVFYDNVFYLAHLGHLSLDYVDNLSPGEYTYMIRKLESTLASQRSSSVPDEEANYATDDDMDDGFFESQQ